MRTTVNIDEDLLAAAEELAERTHRTIDSLIEEGLRRTIDETNGRAGVVLPDYAYAGGLRPGVDLYDKSAMGQLLDGAR